jgi:hypothetical protein
MPCSFLWSPAAEWTGTKSCVSNSKARRMFVVLDRREGDRRTPQQNFTGTNRRRTERRRHGEMCPYLKLGWTVLDTNELAPWAFSATWKSSSTTTGPTAQ